MRQKVMKMIKLSELIKRLEEIEKAYPNLFEVKVETLTMHFSLLDNEKNIIIMKDKK